MNVVTGLRAGRSGVRIPGSRNRFFCSPVVQNGSGDLSLRVKQTGPEADLSSQTTVEVNNVWRFTAAPPTCLRSQYMDRFSLVSRTSKAQLVVICNVPIVISS